MKYKFFSEFMRDIIFGIEDGLVSILGLVVGVAAASPVRSTILIAAFAGTIAAAISMSAGDYLSTKSAQEVMSARKRKEARHIHPLMSAVVIGLVFIAASFIPISPYIIFSTSTASVVSTIATFITLFLVGASKCTVTKRNWFISGIEMVMIAGIAALAGYLVGHYFAIVGV